MSTTFTTLWNVGTGIYIAQLSTLWNIGTGIYIADLSTLRNIGSGIYFCSDCCSCLLVSLHKDLNLDMYFVASTMRLATPVTPPHWAWGFWHLTCWSIGSFTCSIFMENYSSAFMLSCSSDVGYKMNILIWVMCDLCSFQRRNVEFTMLAFLDRLSWVDCISLPPVRDLLILFPSTPLSREQTGTAGCKKVSDKYI